MSFYIVNYKGETLGEDSTLEGAEQKMRSMFTEEEIEENEVEIVSQGMRTPSELLKTCRKELTEKAQSVIENSDQFFDEFAGMFANAEEFNKFVDENY